MAKKFDINKPRVNNNNLKKTNHNFNHYNYEDKTSRRYAPLDEMNSRQPINSSTYYEREYELPKSADLTVKLPIPKKIVLTSVIIGTIFIFLMLFVALFGNKGASGGYLTLAGQCPKVTVVNTDCDSNADNCSNKYDGEVDFEDYIAGVVAAEVGATPNNQEYYQVMSMAARTYFYSNFNSDCTVDGNATYQAYMDVEDSSASEIIKDAVSKTRGKVIVKDKDLVEAYYSSACVVNADNEKYYIRYGSKTLGDAQLQEIPKQWDTKESAFRGYLKDWYSLVDQSDNDYYSKDCPNNHDYGMTQIGALYLITKENYTSEEVIKYYYGNDSEIKNINVATSGSVEGFINPVNTATCSSNFGCRLHPTKKTYKFHEGIDLGAVSGTTVYAPKDGKITAVVRDVPGASTTNACGNSISIDHGDGTSTRYCHLLYNSIPSHIEVGAIVSQGEEIASVGATGNVTGPHLHYEVYLNGTLVNPADYLDLSSISGGSSCSEPELSSSYCGR